MVDFSSLEAEDVLKKGPLDEYKRGINFFYSELERLNKNIYIINHILQFPFKMFCAAKDRNFFGMVLLNFFDISVLMITRLATDTKGDLCTLRQFKNRVRKDYLKAKYKQDFANWLKKVKFDTTTEKMLKRAKNLRTQRIAHLKKDIVFNISKVIHLNFAELEKLRDALNSLLDALSFNLQLIKLPASYYDKVQHPKGFYGRSDIERLLCLVAKDSYLLKMPETHPEKWKHQCEHMTDKQIRLLNIWRKKCNLREV